jgi:hypothetical protein
MNALFQNYRSTFPDANLLKYQRSLSLFDFHEMSSCHDREFSPRASALSEFARMGFVRWQSMVAASAAPTFRY